MIDHIKIYTPDIERARRFYVEALEPLHHRILLSTTGPVSFGFGSRLPAFWIQEGGRSAPVHIAFAAPDGRTVDAFHAAALAAGGQDHGAPGPRPQYHVGYYGAFVLDPDGHNVEAVCHVARPHGGPR